MNEKMFDALEMCIQALETGADLESVLKRYPEFEEELRPMLETAGQARMLAASDVPADVVRRGRSRVLQHAAEVREAAVVKPRISHRFSFARLATSLALTMVLLLSGTGLVNASSGALPGDNLYQVKRTWEDVRLVFTFTPQHREELESEYEQERLDEIDELLMVGRQETITFYGLVTQQTADQWMVSGVPVIILPSTQLPGIDILVGAPIKVVGATNAQGFVVAQRIDAVAPGSSLPPLEPSESMEANDRGDSGERSENEVEQQTVPQSTPKSAPATIETPSSKESEGESEHRSTSFEFRGVVESQQGDVWVINGQKVNVGQAAINGQINIGAVVKLEGYYDSSGQFIVTKIETRNSDSGTSIQDNQKDDNESSIDSNSNDSSENNHSDSEDTHTEDSPDGEH